MATLHLVRKDFPFFFIIICSRINDLGILNIIYFRAHIQLVDIPDKGDNRYVVKTRNQIEVEGNDTPAMIAEWLFMLFYEPSP